MVVWGQSTVLVHSPLGVALAYHVQTTPHIVIE